MAALFFVCLLVVCLLGCFLFNYNYCGLSVASKHTEDMKRREEKSEVGGLREPDKDVFHGRKRESL